MSNPIGGNSKTIHVYEPEVDVRADLIDTSGRAKKNTDVLVFDRIGISTATQGADALLYKRVSNNSALKKIRNFLMGRHTARAQDVYLIFRTHGMNEKAARTATQHVANASKGLSGLSATALEYQLKDFQLKSMSPGGK